MTNSISKFLRGIDVSIYQGTIDWAKVAADGVNFAIIRASHGITSDNHFATNWGGAKGVKIKRGAYHYFVPTDDVQAQVDLFVKQIGTLSPGDLAPALDLEDPDAWASIPKADRMPIVLKWLKAVEVALGIKLMIYTSLNFIGQVFDDATALGEHDLWIAYYAPATVPPIPSVWKTWRFWQWSSKTTVAGIVGDVDGDWFNGTLQDLEKCGVPGAETTAAPQIGVDTSGTQAAILATANNLAVSVSSSVSNTALKPKAKSPAKMTANTKKTTTAKAKSKPRPKSKSKSRRR